MRTLALSLAFLASAAFAQDPAPPKPTDADAKAKTDAWKEAVKAGTSEAKSAAISAMGECPHVAVINTLLAIAKGEAEDVRVLACKALGRMGGNADAAKALHAAIKPNEERLPVFKAVFAAIAEVNHPSSVAVCKEWACDNVAARDSEDFPMVDAAADALGALKWKTAVEALLDIWHKNKVVGRDRGSSFKERVRKNCNQALQRLTGEKLGNLDEWEDWWNDNSKKFNADMTAK